jgi:hypothetical protein
MLCIQSLGHLIGIIFCNNGKIAAFVSVDLFVLFLLFANYMIPLKELHYALQWLSNISAHKLIFESIIILFYGFDRCANREFSGVLYVLDIDDNTFYSNARILIIQFILIRSLALIALIIKTNSFSNRKRVKNVHKFAEKLNSLKPSNPYIPGLNSNHYFKFNN